MNQCSPVPAAKLYLKSKSSLILTAHAEWHVFYTESKSCKFVWEKKKSCESLEAGPRYTYAGDKIQ